MRWEQAHDSDESSADSIPRQKNVDDVDKEKQSPSPATRRIGIRGRIKHLTWAWFTTTMSTGGLALVLNQTPHKFTGLETIGKIVFIFDLVLFALLVAAITTRFALCPRALGASLTDPTEAFYFPTFWLSISTIISNTQVYGVSSTGPWLPVALRVVFWTYAALSLLVAIGLFLTLFATPAVNERCTPATAAPSWILPVFPAMLCGTLSGVIAKEQPAHHAFPMIVAGVAFQGLGWTVYCAVLALCLLRMLHGGLLPRHQRPAMFMLVGPPSFTALALIANASAVPSGHAYFAEEHPGAADMLLVLTTWIGVFLWCLAFWAFAVALAACLVVAPRVKWTPAWWAYVFPNVGFTLATVQIGKQLGSEAVLWVGSVMTALLVAAWLFIAGAQIRAISMRQVLWPGMDEDREEPQVKEERVD